MKCGREEQNYEMRKRKSTNVKCHCGQHNHEMGLRRAQILDGTWGVTVKNAIDKHKICTVIEKSTDVNFEYENKS